MLALLLASGMSEKGEFPKASPPILSWTPLLLPPTSFHQRRFTMSASNVHFIVSWRSEDIDNGRPAFLCRQTNFSRSSRQYCRPLMWRLRPTCAGADKGPVQEVRFQEDPLPPPKWTKDRHDKLRSLGSIRNDVRNLTQKVTSECPYLPPNQTPAQENHTQTSHLLTRPSDQIQR